MKTKLPPLAEKTIALAILVLLLTAVYVGAVAPLLDEFEADRAAIADTQMLISRYQQAGRRVTAQRALLAQLAQRQEAENGFLDGANETLAEAALQSRIKAIVESARGELKTTQILPTQRDGQFQRIAIRGEMSMALPAAQRVLYALETTSPLLFIDNVDIHSHAADRQQDRNDDIVMLEMTLDVYGYMQVAK